MCFATRSYLGRMNAVSIEAILVLLFIGAIAGWLAGALVRGFGFGLVGNIVVGIVGAALASFLLPMAGISIAGGIIGSIIHSTIGAVVLLLLIKLIKR